MQTLVQVICTKGPSLRDKIVNDEKLASYGLSVESKQKPGRARGWSNLVSTDKDIRGALKIEWDADARMLLCRVVNRGKGRPHRIVGDFVDYVLSKFQSQIQLINIVPPRGTRRKSK